MDVDLRALFEKVIDWPPAEPAAAPTPDASSKSPPDPLPGGGGVYLLTDERDRPIQFAAAADLRRTLRNRLAAPTALTAPSAPEKADEALSSPGTLMPKSKRPDLGAIVRRIWWRPAASAFELTWEYYRLARVLLPDDYLQQVAFGPAWFIHVDRAAAIPRFQVGKYLRGTLAGGAGVDLGPFGTQSEATRLTEILEECFDLCRYYKILEQAPHGQACAYFEMGKCPAPCNGSIPMEHYREMISAALAFALGQREPLYSRLQGRMREAAARREFEKAAATKQKWDRARSIEHDAFRLVHPAEQFNYLVVQSGGTPTRLKPFFVRGGGITSGQVVRLKEIETVTPAWIQTMQSPPPPDQAVDPRQRSEQTWLVSKFLFKKETPGLFVHTSELTSPEDLAARIRARWSKPQPDSAELPSEPDAEGLRP